MVQVRLPDGNIVEHSAGATARDVVEGIGPGLARQAVAAKLNGEIVDLDRRLPDTEEPIDFAALTPRDAEGLYVMRHSAAHIMAEAICTLWPQTRLVYGPPVDTGFYYDIDLDHAITPEDFEAIEQQMAAIIKAARPFTRYELAREPAMRKLAEEGNEYKLDNAERAEGDTLSFYVTGAADSGCFEDLCRGPHVPDTSRVGAVKVMQVAGAYHHGDASRKMLQRVYGTAFPDKKTLKQHLAMLEEARKRDHRRVGQELGLFTFDPLVGAGLALWKPRGAILRHTLETYMREQLLQRGYQPVYTPHIGQLDLYRTSGHFPYYRESQFPPLYESDVARLLNELWVANAELAGSPDFGATEQRLLEELASANHPRYEQLLSGDGQRYRPGGQHPAANMDAIRHYLKQEDGFLLKPMNCPHHIRIFASDPRSYRDLPVRLAEFGTVYRYEKSGEVHGLTRVRGFTQDDAHIFCTQSQLQRELADCIELTQQVLRTLALSDFRVRVGLRDDSDKYVGDRGAWEQAQAAIRQAVGDSGLDFVEEPGEAAFYGPKIDFVVKDTIGRDWQLGTVQVDYNLPQRFTLEYVGDDNHPHRPVMIHRAPFGSLERFVGILIEHFNGAFPLWLAPVQARICTVSDKSRDYGLQVLAECQRAGLRVEFDQTSERIGAKIRAASLFKIPYVLVIGEQEASDHNVNVRTRDGRQLGNCSVGEFLAACAKEIVTHGAAD